MAFEDGRCVGTCAFTGGPREGKVELAYFTFPGEERQGVATRMAGQLITLARAAAPCVMITAHTLPGESPSTKVLRKAGFTWDGPRDHPEDGPVWVWRAPAGPAKP